MSATGELRARLNRADAAVTAAQKAVDQAVAYLADAVRLADRLDDEAIDAADRFISRGRGGAA